MSSPQLLLAAVLVGPLVDFPLATHRLQWDHPKEYPCRGIPCARSVTGDKSIRFDAKSFEFILLILAAKVFIFSPRCLKFQLLLNLLWSASWWFILASISAVWTTEVWEGPFGAVIVELMPSWFTAMPLSAASWKFLKAQPVVSVEWCV